MHTHTRTHVHTHVRTHGIRMLRTDRRNIIPPSSRRAQYCVSRISAIGMVVEPLRERNRALRSRESERVRRTGSYEGQPISGDRYVRANRVISAGMQTDRSGVLHYFRQGPREKEKDVQSADNREGNPDCVYTRTRVCVCVLYVYAYAHV